MYLTTVRFAEGSSSAVGSSRIRIYMYHRVITVHNSSEPAASYAPVGSQPEQ